MPTPRGTNLKGLNLPTTGALWGADSSNFATGTHAIEAAYTSGSTTGGLGRQMAIRRRHYTGSSWSTAAPGGSLTFGNNSSSTGHALGVDEKADALLGLVPCVVLGSQGNSFPIKSKTSSSGKTASSSNTATVNGHQGLDRVTAGEFDSSFTSLANTLNTIVDTHGNPAPVMLILWQEMDAPAMNAYGGFQGGTTGAGQTTYINAFAHVAAIIHANASNVIVGWCPTQFDPDANKTTYYPGNTATDWIWEDVYAKTIAGNIDDLYNLAVTNNKPYGIAESGVQAAANGASIIAACQVAGKSATYSSNLLAFMLWNFPGSSDDTYYQSQAVYDAYNTFANDSYYAALPSISTGGGGGGTAPSNTVAPSISDDSPTVGQVIACATGTWSGTTPMTPTFLWQVSATGTGGWSTATGSGNTSQSYTVASADSGKFLRCQVTETNSVGAGSAFSEVTSAVASAGSSAPQVGVMFFENKGRAAAISGSVNLAAFDSKYMSFTNLEGTSNPSCPDYTAFTCGDLPLAQNQGTPIGTFGGSPQGIDAPSAGVGWAGSLHNLFDQLSAAGYKWKTYEEGPSVVASGWNSGDANLTDTPQCATRHSPGAFYTTPSHTIGSAHSQGRYTFTELTNDINNSSFPDFFWITGGNYHVGHAPGDLSTLNSWIGSTTSGLVASIIAAMKPNGILIMAFDNIPTPDTTPPITGTGVIYCVVAGQNVTHSSDGTKYNHFSMTKGIQNLFNVPNWTTSVDAAYTAATAVTLPNIGGGGGGGGGTSSLPSETPDTSVPQSDGNDVFKATHILGAIYVGGDFTTFGGSARNHFAAYGEDNVLRPWNPNADGDGYKIIPGPAGKVFVCGAFSNIGGQPRSGVALIGSDTTVASPAVDGTFIPPALDVNLVTGMAYDATKNALYIAGDFTTVGGTARTYFACLNATTGALMPWKVTIDPGSPPSTYHPGRRVMLGKHPNDPGLYINGAFQGVNGSTRLGIACVANDPTNASPALDPWAPDVQGVLGGPDVGSKGHDIDIKPDGTKLIVSFAGGGSGNDGDHGIAYQLVNSSGVLSRQNTRLWTTPTVPTDSGDHNACGCDDTYTAFGHHGNGQPSNNPTGIGNPKCFILDWTGQPVGWVVNTFSGGQGVYTVEFSSDRFLVGGQITAPRAQLVQFDRTVINTPVIGSGTGLITITGSAHAHAVVHGSSTGLFSVTGAAIGTAIGVPTTGSWWKVVNNGGRGNGVIPDPNQTGRALGIGDIFGHHTTTNNGKTWYPRQKGVVVQATNPPSTAFPIYGRTGIWSIKNPGTAYLGVGALQNSGGVSFATKINIAGADPYTQTRLAGSIVFGTNSMNPTPDGVNTPDTAMPRMGTGHLMDVYYTGSGSEYIFGAHNAGLCRWVDEAVPVNLLTGTFDGGSISTPCWKAMIVHVETGGVPVIYAATYGLAGWTGSVIRVTNILSGTAAVTTLSGAPTNVCDFAADANGNLYACGVNHIWQVTNSGTTWTAIDGGQTSGRIVGSLDISIINGVPTMVAGMSDYPDSTMKSILVGTFS